jgi:hypothetical protein
LKELRQLSQQIVACSVQSNIEEVSKLSKKIVDALDYDITTFELCESGLLNALRSLLILTTDQSRSFEESKEQLEEVSESKAYDYLCRFREVFKHLAIDQGRPLKNLMKRCHDLISQQEFVQDLSESDVSTQQETLVNLQRSQVITFEFQKEPKMPFNHLQAPESLLYQRRSQLFS